MLITYFAVFCGLGLFLAMLALMELGARAGRRRLALDPEGARAGSAATEGAVFALLGLLIAFTFSGAAQRFDERRHLIVAESNAIGTAWLRLDTLAQPARDSLRADFRDYLDARLSIYADLRNAQPDERKLARCAKLQADIWAKAVAAIRDTGPTPMLVLPALNEMFDIASERMAAVRMHPPALIFALLILLALGCALLSGFATAASSRSQWTHRVAFAAVIALTAYTIFDLEYPRLGLVRVEQFDSLLVDLRASMK